MTGQGEPIMGEIREEPDALLLFASLTELSVLPATGQAMIALSLAGPVGLDAARWLREERGPTSDADLADPSVVYRKTLMPIASVEQLIMQLQKAIVDARQLIARGVGRE